MKPKAIHIALLMAAISQIVLTQDCPKWGDKEAALAFLQEHKTNGTTADPDCVSTAFATLAHDKSSAEALVGLLQFERSTKNDDFRSYGRRYPAIGALMTIGKVAVPYLVKAIKENPDELARKNAAHTLGAIFAPCVRGLIANLAAEAAKPGTSAEEHARLRAAEEYLRDFYPPCKSETS